MQQDNMQMGGYPPSTAPPPPYQQFSGAPNPQYQPSREDRYQAIINKHEISQQFASKLQKLNTFKIVFVFDDSGSMSSPLEESPLNKGLMKATRWDELKYFAQISIDIANIFNQEGTDVYFLNRPMARNVRTPDDLIPYMVAPPGGYTPIPRVLGTVLNNNSPNFLGEKKLLIIIVTDGEPTDDQGRQDIAGFRNVLKARGPHVYTTIVSCTDEEETMNYLNNWDRQIPRLDVVDDYRSEKNEVLRAQGRQFRFTFGDYVVKSLLGSIDASLDNFDEGRSGCCVIL